MTEQEPKPAETHVRAVTMQVIEPLSATWKELRDALAEMWAMTTQASNWMMRELYMHDVRREGQEKMPPMPKTYLYPQNTATLPFVTATNGFQSGARGDPQISRVTLQDRLDLRRIVADVPVSSAVSDSQPVLGLLV